MKRNTMTMSSLPDAVTIFEVGPRDGLQNEANHISVEDKVQFIALLNKTGVQKIEAASFVSPKWVPQMANSGELMQQLPRNPSVLYTALTPNEKGIDAAILANVDEAAIFTSASEQFSQKNINCSIEESILRFIPVVKKAHQQRIAVRGYVSCVAACPYEGSIDPKAVLDTALRLLDIGCYQISLGDTIGKATAKDISLLLEVLLRHIPVEKLALHSHDTYGQALSNIFCALQYGITTFDSAVAGLGGCPYAKGASGNVATEDLLYLLHGLGVHTGIDLNRVVEAGQFICKIINKPTQSKVAKALLSKC